MSKVPDDRTNKVNTSREEDERKKAFRNIEGEMDRKHKLLKQQQERLERQKSINKENSLSAKMDEKELKEKQALEIQQAASLSPSGRQLAEARSRLFDFKKDAARSLRQLGEIDPPQAPPAAGIKRARRGSVNTTNSQKKSLRQNKAAVAPPKPGETKEKEKEPPRRPSVVTKLGDRRKLSMIPEGQKRSADHNSTILQRMHSVAIVEEPEDEEAAQPPAGFMARRKSSEPHIEHHHKEALSAIAVYDRRRSVVASDRRMSMAPLLLMNPSSSSIPIRRKSSVSEDEDGERLRLLFDKAIKTVQNADDTLVTDDKYGHSSKSKSKAPVTDQAALLADLQAILSEARAAYSARKPSTCQLDMGPNRAQKKRIEHLEKVLKQLNPGGSSTDIDPASFLRCGYLRLSANNVDALEDMLRKEGKDPGIHIHTDLSSIDVFENLQAERRDVIEGKEKIKQAEATNLVTAANNAASRDPTKALQAGVSSQRIKRRSSITAPRD